MHSPARHLVAVLAPAVLCATGALFGCSPPAPPASDAGDAGDGAAPMRLAGTYAVDMTIGADCASLAPLARVAMSIGEPVGDRVEVTWQLVGFDPSAGSPSVQGSRASMYGECTAVLLADGADAAGRDGTSAGIAPGQPACAIGNVFAQLQGGTARRTADGVQVQLHYLGTVDPVTICTALASSPR